MSVLRTKFKQKKDVVNFISIQKLKFKEQYI